MKRCTLCRNGETMKNFYVLAEAVQYIEDHLCEKMTAESIADACYVSLSSLQKLFRYAFHIGLMDYVTRRRMTHAANLLVNSDMNILDIAMKYQYNSHEVFARAFSKTWNSTPSVFRRQWTFTGLFPKLDFDYSEDGRSLSMKRKYDITELYDYLKQKENTYVVCFDMVHMMEINDRYGREAGDKAIVECLRRIDEAAKDGMLTYRIGGDEFVLVTGYERLEQAQEIAGRVLAANGQTIEQEGTAVPVSLRAGYVLMEGSNVKYGELYTKFNEAINASKV